MPTCTVSDAAAVGNFSEDKVTSFFLLSLKFILCFICFRDLSLGTSLIVWKRISARCRTGMLRYSSLVFFFLSSPGLCRFLSVSLIHPNYFSN